MLLSPWNFWTEFNFLFLQTNDDAVYNLPTLSHLFTASAGGPGTVYLEQTGLGVGTLLIDARETDPEIKLTNLCDDFDIEESGTGPFSTKEILVIFITKI